MNETFKVATLFNCYYVDEVEIIHQFDPVWRQNALSCRVLLTLQQMFNFNITFMTQELNRSATIDREINFYPQVNGTSDIYLKLMAVTNELLNHATPIEAVFVWRFGFILRREYLALMRPYYSLPFAKSVWICIAGMIVLVTLIFYIVRRWEKRLNGHLECNFIYEFYTTIGVVCQHFLPVSSDLWSQRMAYFFFVIFAFITYSYYTSNLLSYIVTDKEGRMDLRALVYSDYELKILENMKLATERRVNSADRKLTLIEKRLSRSKAINISAGLEDVRTKKTALLCDYPTVYSTIARTFENEEICELEEVDIFSNIKMYLHAGKHFRYTEKFKIGTLRLREAGIIKRLISIDGFSPLSCDTNVFYIRSQFEHIVAPLLIIIVLYIFACVILIGEILFYENYKLWPYVN
ncbi:ionotropic receptor 75a-like [Battus philenor]|uniref:ionotropic receptor 75a-like n=1 Tax=Battus philenor TaxID=42288 RepID=UPI0035D00D1D